MGFSKDFLWGAATASYQIEGAWNEDGKVPSVWDAFCHDTVSLDGLVHAPNRIHYLHRYLLGLRNAAEEGVDIRGYFQWSLMDNFEWAEGFAPRFGMIFCDYVTKKHIPKDSADWYKRVIETNGAEL